LKFNEYLKSCRKKYNLTQEELVQELYNFNDIFAGLDVRTLSRWEKGSTKPTATKQVVIVQLFQKYSTHIFPCFSSFNKNAEEELCRTGIKNLIGQSKEHIVNFPTNIFTTGDIDISHVRSHSNMDLLLKMPQSILSGRVENYFQITVEHLSNWALHPSNLFLIAQSNYSFIGMFFTLRLKPEVFKKLLSFELKAKDIDHNDFATFEEDACDFPIAMFAYNEKVASLLYIRYYAYLISNQDTIIEVGSTPLLKGAKKILEKMHYHHIKDKEIDNRALASYSAPLKDILINEDVLKMVFQKQDCPEDSY
jgi:transcriptional regulator with XRE-family HTH domain